MIIYKLTNFNRARKGQKLSKEHVDKVICSLKNRIVSEETRVKMSESRKFAWDNGVYSHKECSERFKWLNENRPSPRKKSVRIVELDLIFDSLTKCAKYLHGVPSNICSVLKGKLKQYKGHTFEYVEVEV